MHSEHAIKKSEGGRIRPAGCSCPSWLRATGDLKAKFRAHFVVFIVLVVKDIQHICM